eukprot:6463315-Ditylum_brightwellii.AAC.1
MPVDTEINLPLLGTVVKRILDVIEYEWALPITLSKVKRLLTMVAGYIAVTYTYSLQGNKGFWVDGDDLIKHIEVSRNALPIGHVVVSLVGFFKAKTGERKHVLSLDNITHLGIRVRGKKECPAFCDEDDFILMSHDVEKRLFTAVIAPFNKEQLTQLWCARRGKHPPPTT